MNLNTVSFELLGETVDVETNDAGTMLRVTFGDKIIEDSSGNCVDLPYRYNLYGAALEKACRKDLKEIGEAAIRNFIHNKE